MIEYVVGGSTAKTEAFLRRLKDRDIFRMLDSLAREGVDALSSATPRDSGLTAGSWGYKITRTGGSVTISWTNSHVVDGTPVVILLQYGHGTGTGGYVAGRDFINPAIKPIFDRIDNQVWKAVTSA